YGPGRYDPSYEQKGEDYPIGYVRWTAQRNFEAVLDMIADGRLEVAPLVSHCFPFERSAEAYELIQSGEFHLGVLLEYAENERSKELTAPTIRFPADGARTKSKGSVGFIGAGSYASKTLIPAFVRAGASLAVVGSRSGLSAATAARKF